MPPIHLLCRLTGRPMPPAKNRLPMVRKLAFILMHLVGALSGANFGVVFAVQFDQEDVSSELPRFEPLAVSDAIHSFEVAEGFQIDLIASEPLVVDPVAFWFHPNGRLFVIEMIDYSEQDQEHLGRVAVLYDDDGDGRMDRRTTYAEGLSWPTAIHGWRDGVLVIAPPDLLFLRDQDGDGVCDQRDTWFTGFARSNVQGMANSLRWSIEGYIEGTSSSNGGVIVDSRGNRVDLRGRDFRIDPLNRSITATSGGGQHGMCFNVWGDKFVTSNSDHLQQIIDLESWLTRRTPIIPIPSSRRSIASDGTQADVYRISPMEPWRIVRTRLRVEGRVPGPIEGGGRAAGYFTGATGTWVMPGDGPFGYGGHDVAFICDVGSNLVHRKKLTEEGLYFRGDRMDPNTEFVRSRDTWFRPVQLGDGPDGNLYIADMYREVIEHPLSLPPIIKQHLDLTSGRDRGRIYRVSPKPPFHVQPVSLSPKSNRELVSLLEHDLPWQRFAAQQQLLELSALDVQDALEQIALHGQKPESRLLAYATLLRLGFWNTALAGSGLQDKDEHIVAASLRWIEATPPTALEDLEKQLEDTVTKIESQRINLEIAKLIGDAPEAIRRSWMSLAFRKEWDAIITAIAVDSMIKDDALALDILRRYSMEQVSGGEPMEKWFRLLLPTWLKALEKNVDSMIGPQFRERFSLLLNELLKDELWRTTLLDIVSLLPTEERATFSKLMIEDVAQDLRTRIQEELQSLPEGKLPQVEAIRWSWLLAMEDQKSIAETLLHPRMEAGVLQSFLRNFLADQPEVGVQVVLESLPSLLPAQRAIVLDVLLEHHHSSSKLAKEFISGSLPKRWLNSSQSERLQIVLSPEEKERWNEDRPTSSRWTDDQIARKADALETLLREDEVSRQRHEIGREIFTRECAACHQFKQIGHDVGPPLKSVIDKSTEQILIAVLDPNREIDPRYELHAVLTLNGRVLSGVLASESANSIEIRSNGGERNVVTRTEIEQIRNLGTSMMPSDLDSRMSNEELASLIAFLRHADD